MESNIWKEIDLNIGFWRREKKPAKTDVPPIQYVEAFSMNNSCVLKRIGGVAVMAPDRGTAHRVFDSRNAKSGSAPRTWRRGCTLAFILCIASACFCSSIRYLVGSKPTAERSDVARLSRYGQQGPYSQGMPMSIMRSTEQDSTPLGGHAEVVCEARSTCGRASRVERSAADLLATAHTASVPDPSAQCNVLTVVKYSVECCSVPTPHGGLEARLTLRTLQGSGIFFDLTVSGTSGTEVVRPMWNGDDNYAFGAQEQSVRLMLADPGAYTIQLSPKYVHRSALWAPNEVGVCPILLSSHVNQDTVVRVEARPPAPFPTARAVCNGGGHTGRWVGKAWVPHGCSYPHVTEELLRQCAAARMHAGAPEVSTAGAEPGATPPALWMVFVGDSLMRGLFFDVLDLMLHERVDRSWGKAVSNGRFDTNATETRRFGPQLDFRKEGMRLKMVSGSMFNLRKQGYDDDALRRLLFLDGSRGPTKPHYIVLGGSVAWDTKFGNISAYAHTLSRVLHVLRDELHRVVWVLPAAIRLFNTAACRACDPKRFAFMSFPRSLAYARVGTQLARAAGVRLFVDAWTMTVGTPPSWRAHEHYDALYVPMGGGFVSREIANVLLHVVCSERHARGSADPETDGHEDGQQLWPSVQ
jgi:hypothetical protein